MIAYCLADLFNLSLWPQGRRPNYADVRDGIGDLISESLCMVPAAHELTIRLYGGWHGSESQGAQDLPPKWFARALRHFPRRVKRQRLRVEVADHPIWNSSVRILNSIRDSRLSHMPARFTEPTNCHGTDCLHSPCLSLMVPRCMPRTRVSRSVARHRISDTARKWSIHCLRQMP